MENEPGDKIPNKITIYPRGSTFVDCGPDCPICKHLNLLKPKSKKEKDEV